MTLIVNFGTLKTAVSEISHRSESLPEAVAQAEAMIAQRVRALEMVYSATLAEADRVSGGEYTLPVRTIDVISLAVGSNPPLTRRSRWELACFHTSGAIHSYSMAANAARVDVRGIPATDTEFALWAFRRPAALSADLDTHDLLTNAPQLYLHASLHWQHVIFQDLELAEFHRAAFELEVDTLNIAAERSMNAGAIPALPQVSTRGSM